MKLSELLQGITPYAGAEKDIGGISADSRLLRAGDLFVAMPGSRADGRAFIADALDAGAVAVLGRDLPDMQATVPFIECANPRRAYALMARRLHPRQPGCMAAVTGTNGKSSVAVFLRQIWEEAGIAAASIGTLGVQGCGQDLPGGLTSPDSLALHRLLEDLADAGCSHGVLEASSHGLDQHRLDGVDFAVAAFTNLTRDHLDYHGGEEAYFAAKCRLFAELLPAGAPAVVNTDDDFGRRLAALCRRRGLALHRYGHGEDADCRILEQRPGDGGQSLRFSLRGREYKVDLPLIGAFQGENALCALLLALETGVSLPDGLAALAQLEAPAGRMEVIGRNRAGALVIVDYAHTPDALRTVLTTARQFARDRLLVVFGCGGDRDRGKRPQMGAVAADLADLVIVTDDNPRHEDPAVIRREILASCPGATEIADRAAAIAHGIEQAGAGDVLVVAGKGHEAGQVIGDEILPFDDRAAVRLLLDPARRAGGAR